ncbi:hypothetical protein E4T44_00179 [Aureobasidium sp. EXF-8845]|nr:hypothetical protein E4T44_00179 [Aureobasidium sp. EXF-8845]KAI4858144.1 hypothetical protein E4T45_00352 [Aureobasidium sp. EXF-8846]
MSLLFLKSSQRALLRTSLSRAQCLRQTRLASSNPKSASSPTDTQNTQKQSTPQSQVEKSEQPKKHKTLAELDEELRQKMAGASGDGGDAGVEYEDGQPVSMKRSVKNNMFRYI